MRTGTTHREEALKAIEQAKEMIASAVEPCNPNANEITGLQWRVIRATLDYAADEVRAIQELKRARKAKKGVAP